MEDLFMSLTEKLKKLVLESASIAHSFKFPQEIPSNPNPLKLSKWYASEVLTATTQINAIEESFNISSTCKKGCSSCCSQLIAINKPEYTMIEFAVTNFDINTRTKIKDIINEQCNLLSNNGFSATTLDAFIISLAKEHEFQQKYFSMNLQCPFLDDSHGCMIYNIRPSVCWTYRNYGNPRDCSDSWDITTSVKYEDWESRVLERTYQAKKPSRNEKIIILQFALLEILS